MSGSCTSEEELRLESIKTPYVSSLIGIRNTYFIFNENHLLDKDIKRCNKYLDKLDPCLESYLQFGADKSRVVINLLWLCFASGCNLIEKT